MTPAERANPSIINGSRRLRIAKGSGTTTTEVNSLLDRFKQMQGYMRQMAAMPGLGGRMARRATAGSRKARRRSAAGEPVVDEWETMDGRRRTQHARRLDRPREESSQRHGREAPPDADGKEEAAGVPGRRRGQPLAAGRAVHRDPRHLRAAGRAEPGRHRQRQGRALAARRRPADRNRRAAARPNPAPWRSSGPAPAPVVP